MSLVCLVDLNNDLQSINNELPPGVKATLRMDSNRVFVNYSVRYEHKGKKHSLGMFLDKDSAIRALLEHKYRGATITPAKELEARTQLLMLTATKQAADAMADSQAAKPRELLSDERILELLAIKGMFDWQFEEEVAIDVMEDDVIVTITPADLKAYNARKTARLNAANNT